MTRNGSSHAMKTEDRAILVNGEREVLSSTTVADLLLEKGIAEHRGVAVALNGAVVRRTAWHETALKAGDKIEIVHARQGG